jgi:hypothetical protein
MEGMEDHPQVRRILARPSRNRTAHEMIKVTDQVAVDLCLNHPPLSTDLATKSLVLKMAHLK